MRPTTFELFNLFSTRPDWVLEAEVDGEPLKLTGLGTAPVLPGPSRLEVVYLDEPRGLAGRPVRGELLVVQHQTATVRITGASRSTARGRSISSSKPRS